MAQCVICNKQLGFFENVLAMTTKRCSDCDARMREIQQNVAQSIEYAFQQGGVSQEMEQTIYKRFNEVNLPRDLGEPVIQRLLQLRNLTDIRRFEMLQRKLLADVDISFKENTLTADREQAFYRTIQNEKMPSGFAQPITSRLQYLRNLSEIRWGNIPRIGVDIHLDSDEYAHFDLPTTYYKPNKKEKIIPGRIIGTNKKLYFLSESGNDSTTLDWNNIVKVEERTRQIYLQNGEISVVPTIHVSVSKGSGGGSYRVQDSFYSKILIDTLVRLWKRQLVLYKEQNTHGPVPEHVKKVVFQRDKGTCVQCGYQGPYIEYDHIVPRSKGGPNTVENIQLLCRMCNLKKGDRL
jgi:hypothetical protein